MTKEFNLVDECWVRVRLPDNSVQEVSVTDALINAHEYVGLAGETAPQDAAMLRFLMAIPLTVFYRVDAEGMAAPLQDADSSLKRWKSLWDMGRFPKGPIEAYLKQWHEKFWLFHPEIPFYQIPQAKIGSDLYAAKLIGSVSESKNTYRHFASCAGEDKREISPAQAARWLLHLMYYDDRGGAPKAGNLRKARVGWLGQIGFVAIQGKNLFETIMRNCVFPTVQEEIDAGMNPSWELEIPRTQQSTEIEMPLDQAAILTTQCRRIILNRNSSSGKIYGYTILGGDYWENRNAFREKMTTWRKIARKDEEEYYIPRKYDPESQLWQEFSSFALSEDPRPGVIEWNVFLADQGALTDRDILTVQATSMIYGTQDACIDDFYSGSLSMHFDLLREGGAKWTAIVTEEVQKCSDTADLLCNMLADTLQAKGASSEIGKSYKEKQKATGWLRSEFYFQIDQPFRSWLESIDPEADDPTEKTEIWHETVRRIAMDIGKSVVMKGGIPAFTGRIIQTERHGKVERRPLTSPGAYNRYTGGLWELYPARKEEEFCE